MRRYVMVSGASSGIGKAAAEALAQRGFDVFAGALNETEAQAMRETATKGITPVVLDVTQQKSVTAALEYVTEAIGGEGRLFGLINCAGINYNAPLHVLEPAEIMQMINVNFAGSILLTRAALPLLQQGVSRLVFISSATASTYSPTVGVYGGTKSGIGAFADALRIELRPLGIGVAIIEPGVIRTPMTKLAPATLERMLSRMGTDDRKRYEPVMRKIVHMSASPDVGITTEHTSRAILRALTDPQPRIRYRIGTDSRAAAVVGTLPYRVQDWIQRSIFKL